MFLDSGSKDGVTQSGVTVDGNSKGGGGSALSGSTGSSNRGSIYNSSEVIINGYKSSKFLSLLICDPYSHLHDVL